MEYRALVNKPLKSSYLKDLTAKDGDSLLSLDKNPNALAKYPETHVVRKLEILFQSNVTAYYFAIFTDKMKSSRTAYESLEKLQRHTQHQDEDTTTTSTTIKPNPQQLTLTSAAAVVPTSNSNFVDEKKKPSPSVSDGSNDDSTSSHSSSSSSKKRSDSKPSQTVAPSTNKKQKHT